MTCLEKNTFSMHLGINLDKFENFLQESLGLSFSKLFVAMPHFALHATLCGSGTA